MSTNDEVVRRLRAFTADDFNYDNPDAGGWEDLDTVCSVLADEEAILACAPAMFELMERLDTTDLGSPGPLVHTLETRGVDYEPLLRSSVLRKPAPLSVWMVNRILNAEPADRAGWIALLELASAHPHASAETREDALDFLDHQRGRSA